MVQRVMILGEGQIKERICLIQEGEQEELFVLFVLKGRETLGLDTITEHVVQKTKANVWVRGVVMESAEVKISGVIKIDKGAVGTESFLRQNVLILSNTAKADVRPVLEIEADDVKASHAATVGRIDEEQLFYLMSRGLTDKEAKRVLTQGYFNSVIEKIENELERKKTENRIWHLLSGVLDYPSKIEELNYV